MFNPVSADSSALVPLSAHPAAPCSEKLQLAAQAARLADGSLQLHFELAGALERLKLPPWQDTAGFADGLWQHSCFEVFVGLSDAPRYHEFNFAPSGHWAAYAFSAERQRDPHWSPALAPQCAVRRSAQQLSLSAQIPAALLPAPASAWQIGLTAVIETASGALSYWALKHVAAQPDFHQAASFILPR
ncbi:DOMON-like domain-containing protein [Uliginosibacterium sediminicola]|uniref:DOMON-like domain-containing protein n=1 Tax=Uliginosibacterium sediminicola TaxID=2024550 RepID=A0ABU9YY92_9RHOO